MRSRLRARSTVGLAAVLVFGAWFLLGPRFASSLYPEPLLAPAPVAIAEPAAATTEAQAASIVRRTTLGTGGTLDGALARLGLDPALRRGALEVVGHYLNARRLPPQTGLTAELDARGVVRTLCLRSEPARYLRIALGVGEAHDHRAELVELPVERTIETTRGVIRHSVSQALAAMPLGTVLTHAVADVFQWDVDLLVDPRPGDEIRIVYETERLAAVPDDLPRFGDAASSPGEILDVGRILAASYRGVVAQSLGFWIETADGGGYYDPEGRPLRRAFLKSPLNYKRISSGFSRARLHPVTRVVVPHHGVDFAAAPGTPVVATAEGKVLAAGWDGPLGRAVRLRHAGGYVTVYGHLKGFAPGVRAGATVRQNDVIGYVGSTGRATGPHLHYAMYRAGAPINPMSLRTPPVEPLSPALRPELLAAKRRWMPMLDTLEAGPLRHAALEPMTQLGAGS